MLYHKVSCHIISYHQVSYHIVSYHIISCTFLPLVLDVFLNLRQLRCIPEASNVHVFNKVSFILVLAKVSTQQVRSPYGISVYVVSMSVSYHIMSYLSISYNIISISSYINQYHIIGAYVMAAA